jgi:uncharacterized repeat protein (TIGR04042 family)
VPEMHFMVRWPDGTAQAYYSPSLVIKEFLAPGTIYPVGEFLERSRAALTIASKRVEAKYGRVCSRAMSQLALIETAAYAFSNVPGACVTVEAFKE